MRKAACRDYIERAIEALEDMRDSLDDSAADAALAYLEAAQHAGELIGSAVTEAMRSIIEAKATEAN